MGFSAVQQTFSFDSKEGHTQSNVLDKITEALRKLRKMQQEIPGDVEWQHLDENQAIDPQKAAAASSGARVKRPALGTKESSQADVHK